MAASKQAGKQKSVSEIVSDTRGFDNHHLDKTETAAYISDIVLQLRNMAKQADLKFLVYFLEMAFQEAFSQSTRDKEKKKT